MLLIIQTGDPVKQAPGRFSDWFIEGCGIDASAAQVVDVHRGESLPDPNWTQDHINQVIITGSPSMVTDGDGWLRQTQRWLEAFLNSQKPVLGVCYGHQLLADMLGGTVANNPLGRHMGLSLCQLTSAAKNDRLLGATPNPIPTLVSHLQSVTQLPESATRLARCERDPNHAFVCDDHIWGLQFHPEWSPEIMQHYLLARQADLIAEGFDPEHMTAELVPCSDAAKTLKRFITL